MNLKLEFDVTVERHEPSGAFVARCAEFPGKLGIGQTEEDALAHLREAIPPPRFTSWVVPADARSSVLPNGKPRTILAE